MASRKRTPEKICLVYEFLSEQGGLEREIINHAKFLIEEGYDVSVLTCHLDKKILKLLPFEGIKVREVTRFRTKIEALNLITCFLGLNRIKENKADVYLSYSFPANFLIRNLKGKKIMYLNHFPHFLYLTGEEKKEWASGTQGVKRWISVVLSYILGGYLKKLDKRFVKQMSLSFTNSQFTKNRLDPLYDINSVVSYPPLDSRFKPSANRIDEKFIFSSSRIIPDKKYELLIESASFMKNKLPIYLAGSVEERYKRELEKLAARKKVHLKFLGKLTTEEIIDYYTNASVFAFPTPGEDFGLVPAESIACGTPVVIWGDGAGPTEQIIHGLNGYHAKPIDCKDFGSKLDKVIEERIKMKNQKKIVESSKKFSYSEIKRQFLREIKRVI